MEYGVKCFISAEGRAKGWKWVTKGSTGKPILFKTIKGATGLADKLAEQNSIAPGILKEQFVVQPYSEA